MEYKYLSYIDRVSEMADDILRENVFEDTGLHLLHDGVQQVINEVSKAIVQFNSNDLPIVIEGLRVVLNTCTEMADEVDLELSEQLRRIFRGKGGAL